MTEAELIELAINVISSAWLLGFFTGIMLAVFRK